VTAVSVEPSGEVTRRNAEPLFQRPRPAPRRGCV